MDYKPRTFNSLAEREDYFRHKYTELIGELGINFLIKEGFLTAPASTKYHGAYEGGLFDHSANVANVLFDLSLRNGLWKENSRSPLVIGILHDLCKIDQYKPMLDEKNDVIPGRYEWNDKPVIKGHGTKSVIYANAMGIRLNEEERACIIYHMGAFTDKDEWNDYTHAVEVYPNVLWTHTADMLVSRCMEV